MIAVTEMNGADRITTGRMDASQITAVSPEQVRIAEQSYAKAVFFTIKTSAQAAAAERYAVLATKCCARAGLLDEERHLYSVQIRYAYLKTSLSLRLSPGPNHHEQP